jgi:hypothetical protein
VSLDKIITKCKTKWTKAVNIKEVDEMYWGEKRKEKKKDKLYVDQKLWMKRFGSRQTHEHTNTINISFFIK